MLKSLVKEASNKLKFGNLSKDGLYIIPMKISFYTFLLLK